MLENAFGHFLIQVGCRGRVAASLERTRIRSSILVCEDSGFGVGYPGVRALASALPFASASVDAVVMPHTLDFAAQPQHVLREAERVLIPEGRLIAIGFNPFSTWGLMRALIRRQRVPWCGQQLSSSRLIDWLDLLGFQLEMREWLLFRPPMRSAHSRRFDWLEEFGVRWWPMLGGVYVIRAVKRVSLAPPARPRWKARASFIPGSAIKPTVREGNHGA
jgi:SAM-dependent methyltransferase